MTIRAALDSDVPAIVELLKLSLGESLMPKSEAFWRWKHIDNPFGKSSVLLAFDAEKLIGVRAFMRWEWKQGEIVYKAVRAVDTATHPAYQGKGIFSRLTLQLVERCKEQGVDFIFNTPNKKSMPGYLKMGWQKSGRLPVQLTYNLFRSKKSIQSGHEEYQITDLPFEGTAAFTSNSQVLHTNSSSDYFRWRYALNPNEKYFCLRATSAEPEYRAYFRLKPSRLGIELRVCDYCGSDIHPGTMFRHTLKKVASEFGASFISIGSAPDVPGFLKLPMGPVVTVNYLSDKINNLNFQTWNPSLGDLEMF
jgi:GNAT superfamily N-acetyltransferase